MSTSHLVNQECSQVFTSTLCDDSGPFLRTFTFDCDGVYVSHVDTELDGSTPYVTVGTVVQCGEGVSGTAQILADCGDVETIELSYGANLLRNGDMQESAGVGATSVAGPGWTTTYTVPAGGNLFSGAGAGAATWAYFTTNAGQVTGNHPGAVPIQALTGRSMAVNVGPVLTVPVIQWANIFLENGATYSFEMDAASINGGFSLALRIDGNLIAPVTSPVALSVWEKTRTTFTWTGTSGFHTVSMNSNSAVAGGNDHAFDNFTLRRVFEAQPETRTPQDYDSRVRATIEQVVETTNCNDGRRDTLLADISNTLAAQVENDGATETLVCAAGVTMIRRVAGDGTVSFTTTDGVAATPVAYTIGACAAEGCSQNYTSALCDDNGSFLRQYTFDCAGDYVSHVDTFLDGETPYTTTGQVNLCELSVNFTRPFQAEFILCDDNGTFVRKLIQDNAGTVTAVINLTLDGGTYVPVGTVRRCTDCCPTVIGEGCFDDGVTSGGFTSIRDSDGVITLYSQVDGSVVDPADTVSCVAQLDSTVQRLAGAGTVTIPAGARSVTVVVVAGAPTVTIAADPAVALAAGMSLTWGVDGPGERLLNAHVFTGVLGSDFIVTTTRAS